MLRTIFALSISLFFSSLHAFEVDLPVACTMGVDCWIVNYVDVNPVNARATDYRCGSKTYNKHKGTDFGVSEQMMETGVSVLAAADGVVARLRDNMRDVVASKRQVKALLAQDRGCGNGVFITHEDGWETIYCHMKQNSVAVSVGDKVKAGDVLGEIGNSGAAEFPHLHFGVIYQGDVIDPFTRLNNKSGCNQKNTEPLWAKPDLFNYNNIALFASGFHNTPIDFDEIIGQPESMSDITHGSDALVFWVGYYGARAGDKLELRIHSPLGVWTQQTIIQKEDKARQYYYIGKKLHEGNKTVGQHTGYVKVTRALPGAAPMMIEREATTYVH